MPGKIVKMEDAMAKALEGLAKAQMKTFQELADEAFAALLKKHDRPVDLKDALRKSVRMNGKRVLGSGPKKKRAKKKAA
jgi:hypothetical protein